MNAATDPGALDPVSGISDDEPEDGEIVDEYEDISDYSIPSCGKSDYAEDLLRAISLSSISDDDGGREHGKKHYLPPRKRRAHTKEDHRRRKRKKKRDSILYGYGLRRHKSRSASSSPSDDEDKLDKRTLRRLREAVRINNSSEDVHHNSLRTRLKKMIEPDSQEEEDVETLRTLALLTSKNQATENGKASKDELAMAEEQIETSDSLTDKELTELRLEALKSAVIKKHNERKKRKDLDNKNVAPNENNDKENEKNNIINNSEAVNKKSVDAGKKDDPKAKEPESPTMEEDVDVMRAMLLASMSTKITSVKVTTTPVTSTPLQNKKPAPRPHLVTKPFVPIKPFIINLRSDTESETEKVTKDVGNPIDDTVTKFLRVQREQFEAQQKPVERSISKDSKVKLLSEPKQKEYQLLKQKLRLLANSKRKTRRASLRRSRSDKEGEEAPGKLKATLEQLQIQKDGRLQMKGKYKELMPLIKRVNIASDGRKQCEGHIRRLLGELHEARKNLATSQQTFTELTQQLMRDKEAIDLRLTKLANSKKNLGTNTNCTTTVTKAPTKHTVSAAQKPQIVAAQPEEAVHVLKKPEIDDKEPSPVPSENIEPAPMVVTEEPPVIVTEAEMPASHPIITTVQIKFTDYVSPLGNRNIVTSDPMQMLCPYELFGVCKDQDCHYNHCP